VNNYDIICECNNYKERSEQIKFIEKSKSLKNLQSSKQKINTKNLNDGLLNLKALVEEKANEVKFLSRKNSYIYNILYKERDLNKMYLKLE
jgi:hypothetical protein